MVVSISRKRQSVYKHSYAQEAGLITMCVCVLHLRARIHHISLCYIMLAFCQVLYVSIRSSLLLLLLTLCVCGAAGV